MTDLSPEVAAILARFPKLLSLGGIKTLPVETAKALAKALARHQGTLLTFESLRFLSHGGKSIGGVSGEGRNATD